MNNARPIRWEMASAEWAHVGTHDRERLLSDGWEPFAVAGREVWFRRPIYADDHAAAVRALR